VSRYLVRWRAGETGRAEQTAGSLEEALGMAEARGGEAWSQGPDGAWHRVERAAKSRGKKPRHGNLPSSTSANASEL